MYYENKQRKGKLGQKWKPYYRVVEKTGPVSYIIKNQLDGSLSRVYAGDLMLANIDDWQVLKDKDSRKLRDAAYVVPPSASESETESDSDSEENLPIAKLVKKYKQARESSSDESDIPLMELRKRLRHRNMRQNQNEETEVKDMEINNEVYSDNSIPLSSEMSDNSSNEMEVDEVHSRQKSSRTKKTVRSIKKKTLGVSSVS